MKVDDLLLLEWAEHESNPLIAPPNPLIPVIADPSFLPPDQTPDRRWHLFAHVPVFGIQHYVSQDGLAWERLPGVIGVASMRANVNRVAGRYVMFYEQPLSLFPWRSRVEARVSTDLVTWGRPTTLLEGSLAWHGEGGRGWRSIGNPCVVVEPDGYRLYYSAGLVYLKDCGFYEPKHIGMAESSQILGPYTPHPAPVLSPDDFANLGAGAIKVLKADDGYVGFQNGIYWDHAKAHSGSAIRRLVSRDGLSWTAVSEEPILRPDTGWKRGHVYALDIRQVNGAWRLYFNARDGWRNGREHIGLALGIPPGNPPRAPTGDALSRGKGGQ